MKQVLEGAQPTAKTQLHLDRCLTCRNCETTCPSGVQYGHLLDIGRAAVDKAVPRTMGARAARAVLCAVLPRRWLFAPLLRLGQWLKPVLPPVIARKIPERRELKPLPVPQHARRMICWTVACNPRCRRKSTRPPCACSTAWGLRSPRRRGRGAAALWFSSWSARRRARRHAARYPRLVADDGCGLRGNSQYRQRLRPDDQGLWARARRRSGLRGKGGARVGACAGHRGSGCRLCGKLPAQLREGRAGQKIAFHPPCTLQHGMQIRGVAEGLLGITGYELSTVPDSHLCCGSACTCIDPAAGACARASRQQAGGAVRRHAGRNCHRQYRLPCPPAKRHRVTGQALG